MRVSLLRPGLSLTHALHKKRPAEGKTHTATTAAAVDNVCAAHAKKEDLAAAAAMAATDGAE